MIDLGPGIGGVETEGDLRTGVSGTAYTTLYLVNDIVMTGAITVNATKTSLVIDGNYPIGSSTLHSLTDTNSTDYNLAFGIRSTSSIALTLRNMVIHGRNYYGLPYVVENWPLISDTSGVVVTYENVTYDGPQMTYNCYGRTRYINCDITIRQTGVAPAEEVGEVNRVEIGGVTTIYHTGAEDAVFWFNNTAGNSSLTVLTGARVDIESVNSYFVYNRTALGALVTVSYTLQSDARLGLRVRLGMAFSADHTVSSFTVGEGAEFHYVQTASNGTAATLYIDGALAVRAGGRFWMQAENGTQPLIQFTGGTGRSLTVDNPLSFILYSPGTAALRSAGTSSFSLHGGQVNTWTAAVTPISEAGDFEDRAQYRWFKLNFARAVELNGTFTQIVTTATSNMESEDAPYPADSDLHLHEARVLSVGDWPVDVDIIVDDGRPITGQTEAQANLRAEYEIEDEEHTLPGQAEGDGSFSISTETESPPNIPAGTVVTIWSNIPFLIKWVTATAVVTGALSIERAPEQMMFRPRPIAQNPPLLPRLDPLADVFIRDNRAIASRWTLSAAVSGPLTAPEGEILEDGLVFLSSAEAEPVALGGEPVTVFTGGPGQVETSITWPETAGIMVRVLGPIRSGVAYTTQIIWRVSPLEA